MDSFNDSAGSGSPSDCFTAQTIPNIFRNDPINQDIAGIAVGAASIASNLFLPILLRWSNDDVQTSVFMLLSQVYPILISTAFSIGRKSLSLFDAHFAVAVTASPVSVYLAYSSLRDLFGCPNIFFRQITYGKNPIRIMGALLPVLWVTVNIVISFSDTAFMDSDLCKGMTIPRWIEFQTVSNFLGVLDVMGRRDLWNDLEGRGGLGAVSLLSMWIWALYLVRHREDIFEEFRIRRSQDFDRIFFTRWPRLIWHIPMSAWNVVTDCHPWMIFIIVVCLHWSWILGITKGFSYNRDSLSYGQVLSIFSILPPLFAVSDLLRSRKHDLKLFLFGFPRSFCNGVSFIFTGRPNARKLPNIDTEKRNNGSAKRQLKLWIPVIIVWILANGIDVFWIYTYVKAGSTPNPRTPVNDPHAAWKPFSVTLYIFGYCVCCVNILVWISYFDRLHAWVHPATFARGYAETTCIFKRSSVYCLNILFILPIAIVMCFGPLFSPFAALPLSQQYQWMHICDKFPAEVILEGLSYASQNSKASFFYYPPISNFTREHYFDFYLDMATNESNIRTFSYGGVPPGSKVPRSLFPSARALTYDLNSKKISANCTIPTLYTTLDASQTPLVPCMEGYYTENEKLTLVIEDTRTHVVTSMQVVNKEWTFKDDAPSFVLRFINPGGEPGNIALQTAVTKRNHCDTLKICLSSDVGPRVDTLAALGLALLAQDQFADYCTRPRLYNN
ncbi:hypothetical protein BDQ12DRAFT_707569 [Crucibulum laeve]|uniref:Uncharacterized protein n=1 Tax=Crucibulum laeve TaxID=68775 RepID=A0A5C3LJ53_9AGAR|nr:hypothetical protein BDQ12DRAFT_707569 [Crucibulum laeve]